MLLLDGSEGGTIIGLGKNFPSFSSRNLARKRTDGVLYVQQGVTSFVRIHIP